MFDRSLFRHLRIVGPAAFVGALVPAAYGCAHADAAADRHLGELRAAMDREQAARDVELASSRASERDPVDLTSPPADSSARPFAAMRTVVLGASDAEGEDDAADANAAPSLHLEGGGPSASRGRTRPSSRAEAKVEVVGADAPADARRPSILDPEAKRAYEQALSLVHGKQFD